MNENDEFSKEEVKKSEEDKWAKRLSTQCGINDKLLKSALEELSESCYGDSPAAKEMIEELTLSCGFDQKDMEKFVKTVSKNCPIDAKKLRREIVEANGNKAEAWRMIDKSYKRMI